MTARLDETKRVGYVIAAVTVTDPEAVRKVIRGLILPGQRRLHMKNEQPRRRRAIVSALVATHVEVAIYDADREARSACLVALIEDLAAGTDDTRLVIEQDDSLVRSDRHELYQLTRQTGLVDTLEYQHQRAYEDPLLALPDVTAWCWVRSGDWRRRIGPILTTVRQIRP